MTEDRAWKLVRQRKDEHAHGFLLARYTKIAIYTVAKTKPRDCGLDYADLDCIALEALSRAIWMYDPMRGVKFTTLAISIVRGTVLEAVRTSGMTSRLMRSRIKHVESTKLALTLALGRKPQSDELEAAASLTRQQIDLAYTGGRPPLRFSEIVITNNEEKEYDPLNLADPNADVFQIVSDKDLQDTLRACMNTLSPRLRDVVNLYYFEEYSWREIAEHAGLSESRIYQLNRQALNKLKFVMTGEAPPSKSSTGRHRGRPRLRQAA